MNQEQIRALQAHIGTEPDGFWGPRSIAAAQKHLRSLMPTPNPWPVATLSALTSFYGRPGDEHLTSLTPTPVPMYYENHRVGAISCHKKVASSLNRALLDAHAHAPTFVENYDGCFNLRRMRGGSSWSMHAWGIAIDLAAETNGNTMHWPTKADMPFSVMEAFAREGWLSAGAFWSRDAMHFQATQ